MSEHKHINLDYLNDLALGSNDFKIEMITSFLKTTPQNIASMKEYDSNKDYKMVGSIAHKLKTSFSFMGMDEMVTLAKQMQDDGLNNNNVEDLVNKISTMDNAFQLAKAELENELNSLQNG